MGDYYARFCGGRRVRFPPATRPDVARVRGLGGEVASEQVGCFGRGGVGGGGGAVSAAQSQSG
jgi:hypothetical protein